MIIPFVRPDLYLIISLKWNNTFAIVSMILVAVSNISILILTCGLDRACSYGSIGE